MEQRIVVKGGNVTSSYTTELSPHMTYLFNVAAINGYGIGDRSYTLQINTDFDGMYAIHKNRDSLMFQ